MLGRQRPWTDDVLGALVRRRGAWRGRLVVQAGVEIDLVLPGGSGGPEPDAVALAREAGRTWSAASGEVLTALREHAEPYRDAGERDPVIGTEGVRPVHVTVVPLAGRTVLEIGCAVPWDDDHTVGLRFEAGALVELCGSVAAP